MFLFKLNTIHPAGDDFAESKRYFSIKLLNKVLSILKKFVDTTLIRKDLTKSILGRVKSIFFTMLLSHFNVTLKS